MVSRAAQAAYASDAIDTVETVDEAVPRRVDETREQREARIQSLAQLVKSGVYAVQSNRLAAALLEWDPKRSTPRQATDGADRRRAYMREYMRRRRAQHEQPEQEPADA
ncbi:MAG: hypothetical protein HY332_04590 [Chloroflexi bacterium]|nr:hypothetical protein [Chloroflexota bacterium]